MESEKVCSECGYIINEDEPVCVIDEGMETERVVCESCCASLCNDGKIIQCEACGAYFASSTLHDEEIEGHTFTACPACGKDVVEALGRAEFEDEYFCPKYSVVVRAFDGSCRGYIVSAKGRHEVMKRLLEKLDFSGIAEVTIGEVLLKEDEF